MRKPKYMEELLKIVFLWLGVAFIGTVEKVYLQKYTQYGNKSPYRILYTYTFHGKVYHHKSYLLWDKPDLQEHNSIVVYANHSGESTIQL